MVAMIRPAESTFLKLGCVKSARRAISGNLTRPDCWPGQWQQSHTTTRNLTKWQILLCLSAAFFVSVAPLSLLELTYTLQSTDSRLTDLFSGRDSEEEKGAWLYPRPLLVVSVPDSPFAVRKRKQHSPHQLWHRSILILICPAPARTYSHRQTIVNLPPTILVALPPSIIVAICTPSCHL